VPLAVEQIVVADIAATDHGARPIDDEQLLVQALVRVDTDLPAQRRPLDDRVVRKDLAAGICERLQHRVARELVLRRRIDNHAHFDPAARRLGHRGDRLAAGLVVFDQ
jgi:hypothetical protein